MLSKAFKRLIDLWYYSPFFDIYWWYEKKKRWLTNWWFKSHYIHTGLKVGTYDKDTLIEEGLFWTVSHFVSKNGEDALSHNVIEEEVMSEIVDILHFYHIRRPQKEARMSKLMIRASNIYRSKGNFLSARNLFSFEGKALMDLAKELQQELTDETEIMLKKCIEIRSYLWI